MMIKDHPKRADGEESRKRLMLVALKLFAAQGFEATSTRLIAKEANVNISAIAYYFGDKAGLYRAVFTETLGTPKDDIALFEGQDLSLEQALNAMFSGFTEPLKQGELAQLCMRLHMREMVEPTGMWAEEIDNSIAPHHHALLQVLQRHLGLNKVDTDLQRLAFSIVAMGVHLFVGRDVTERIAPELMESPQALDTMRERLTYFALSMVQAEALRRKLSSPAS
jgi:TetR/AcrR family transcriptional regulator, regulator of cefoperazone and chloramphenicol sensitivity